MKNFLPISLIALNLIWRWQNPVPSFAARIKGRTSVPRRRFFCAYRFMVGCVEHPWVAVSFDGTANFAQSAALLFRSNGGSSQIQRSTHHA